MEQLKRNFSGNDQHNVLYDVCKKIRFDGKNSFTKKGDDDLLIVDEYSNKIYYFKSDTERCGKVGCFLLITVVNSVERIVEG